MPKASGLVPNAFIVSNLIGSLNHINIEDALKAGFATPVAAAAPIKPSITKVVESDKLTRRLKRVY